MWLATFGVVLVDQGLDEVEKLLELCLELPEFRTDWVALYITDGSCCSCLTMIYLGFIR